MKFYTSVQQVGDNILYRGYEDGNPVQYKESFSPTLFVPCPTESKFKTLDGNNVKPITIKVSKYSRAIYFKIVK